MRLAPFIVILMIAYLTIGVLDKTISGGSETLGIGNDGTSVNPLWQIFIQPFYWSTTDIIALIFGIIGIAGAITIGAAVFSRSDITILFATFTIFVSFGALPILAIYRFLKTHLYPMVGCSPDPVTGLLTGCGEATIIAGIIAGAIGIYWIFTCLEWWAWRPTTQ